jgi:transcriptional regulator with XRE-family HTH domain
MTHIYGIVGATIRAARTAQDMTLEELGKLSGFNGSFIGQIERNEKKTSLATLSRIANALDVHPSTLIAGAVDSSKDAADKRILAILRGASDGERDLIATTVRHLSKALRKLR